MREKVKFELVKFLLSKKADPNVKNKLGNVVELNSGVETGPEESKKGGTALHLAVLYNGPELIKLLLEKGADLPY